MKNTICSLKFYYAISLLILLSFGGYAGNVEQVYHFTKPILRQSGEYQLFGLNDARESGFPGQPSFPYQQVKLLLTPGESATSMEVVFSDEVIMPGKYNLYPQQDVKPLSDGNSVSFRKDKAVYSQNAFLPADPKGKLLTAFLNGRSFALSTFTPVRYNPVTGQLSYYSNARVIVHSAPDTKALKALDNFTDRNIESVKLADNYLAESKYSLKQLGPTVRYDLIIVCTRIFKNSFSSLRANYLSEGLTSLVVTLDSINGIMPGGNIPEKIRNFIIEMYKNHAAQYVMLAGDDDLIPHQGFYCYVDSGSGYTDQNIPADLYYSALDGNWDTNANGLYGEPGEEDLLPDIAVARLPFSDAAELDHILNKSYKYQFSPVNGEFRNIMMAGERLYSNPLSWGSDYLNLLKGDRSQNGYTTSGIPLDFNYDDMYDETAVWSKQDLMNHLNLGRPMLNHAGHANQDYVMRMGPQDITNANFMGLNGIDHNFTVIYSHGCDCAAFDASDCIAEKMVTIDNFAAAFVGNSRYGWFNEGQTEGPSAHLHREYMDALYSDSLNRIGRAHMESKIASAAWVTAPGQWEPGALRWCFYDCNVLGDPAMAVYTDNPITVNSDFPASLPLQSVSVSGNISSSGKPVKGLTCVIVKDGVMIGKALTDADGNANISFNASLKTPGIAQLTVSGYNCVPKSFDLAFVDYTGLQQNSGNAASIMVSPNPANSYISVEAKLGTKCEFDLKLFNSIGTEVIIFKNELTDDNGRISKNIDVSGIKPGVYTLAIQAGGKCYSSLIVVK